MRCVAEVHATDASCYPSYQLSCADALMIRSGSGGTDVAPTAGLPSSRLTAACLALEPESALGPFEFPLCKGCVAYRMFGFGA